MTYYHDCLREGREVGAAHADEPQLLAMLLDSTAQIMLGAVSPELIFNGAIAQELTADNIAHDMVNQPRAVEALMWWGEAI